MKKIYEPFQMNNISMKNRLVRSATWEGIANPDGSVTEVAYDIYRELARGGVGAIITGFTSVALHDYYFGGMMRLCDDDLIPQYRKLTDIIHDEDVPVITQLALGAYYREQNGRYAQTEPDYMTKNEIKLVEEQFIQAAVRAEKAGFDGVQIHAAHFFFLSRFISPAVNHRTDEYGGSTENRARILVEILKGIRANTNRLHITVKINCNDFTYGGNTEQDCVHICRILDEEGIDSIEVSGNGTSVGGIRA
ncbi:MAG: NADH:flavin oxidoreductase, partial [Mogibacterium sp.]|nr:NADH:flavin oxidoreductase [Mogibacterium sp.]